MLIRKACPGLKENALNSYKALSSKNEWSLFFSDDLVISPTSKSAELTSSSEFPCTAVTAGNLTSVSRQPLLSCYPESEGTNPIT